MKKIILSFLLVSGLVASSSLSAKTAEEEAREYYEKAISGFESGNYDLTLKYLNMVETKMGGTNARIAHLHARTRVKVGDWTGASNACKNYFASKPLMDAGYTEMQVLSERVRYAIDSVNATQQIKLRETREMELAHAQELVDALKAKEEARKSAAERRTIYESEKAERDKEIALIYQDVQKSGNKITYQQFIWTYAGTEFAKKAQAEMNKKWPVPTRVLKNNKYGFQDKKGAIVVKPKYDMASDFVEGRARVGKAGKFGFVDEKGKEVVPLQYESASNYSYGYAAVKVADGEWRFANSSGKLSDDVYKDARSFSEGLAAVADEYSLYGFVDTTGVMVIPNVYNAASSFTEGLVAVARNVDGKLLYGFIDKEGNVVVPGKYEEVKDFQNGIARVKLDGKYGLIDGEGYMVVPCEYDYISEFVNDGKALAKKGIMDVYLDANGLTWARVNGRWVRVNY